MVEIGLAERNLRCPEYQRRKTLKEIEKYLQRNKRLPPPCNKCYTIEAKPTKRERNIEKFIEMLRENYLGMINKERKYQRVYFRVKDEKSKEDFIRELERRMRDQGIAAKVDWRRCCRRLEKAFPYLFETSKKLSEGIQLKML